METGSVITAPACSTSHPLNETLQKALEVLKSHQQWISNRASSPSTVAPEESDNASVPKRNLWVRQDENENFVDNATKVRFPVRKSKPGSFVSRSAAVGSNKVLPTSLTPVSRKSEPLTPPKPAITAWDGPSLTGELVAVDIEEDSSAVVKENGSDVADKSIVNKGKEGALKTSTNSDDSIGVSSTDDSKQNSNDLELITANSPVTDAIGEPTPSNEPMQIQSTSTLDILSATNSTIPPNDTEEMRDGSDNQMSGGHVVAVSPAPKAQQLSLSSSTQSKLVKSELEAFRLENNEGVPVGYGRDHTADSLLGYPVIHGQGFPGDKKCSAVPEPVLHVIVPQQQNESQGQAAVFTLPKRSTVVCDTVSADQSSGQKALKGDEKAVAIGNDGSSSNNVTESNAVGVNVSMAKALDLPELKDPNELIRDLPTIVSPAERSCTLADNDDDRRLREPPPYTLHKKAAILPPACPPYGVHQPTVLPVNHKSTKRHNTPSATAWKSPSSPYLVKEPASVLSVQPTVASTNNGQQDDSYDVSSVTTHTVGSDARNSSEEDEAISSSQPQSPQTSQYFVSPSGNQPLNKFPKLHQAASIGNIRKIQHLLNHGVDINQTDSNGKTALMHCIHPKGVHLASADMLIKEGANLDHQCNIGATVLHYATYQGAVSLVELLLLNGAQVDVRDKEQRLPLHWATHPPSIKCISLILKKSLYGVNDVDISNMTCLMWACYHKNINVVAFLLDKHADREEKDIDGMTAMHWAVHSDDVRCLKLLLSPDMTYFKDKLGRTVMHHAAEKGSLTACEVILKLRLDAVYDTDKKGRTPLHWAAVHNNVDTCNLLLSRGADATQCDSLGKSSLDYARRAGHDFIVAMLTSHETSQSDFARTSRSASLSTLRSRVPSFGEIPNPSLLHMSMSCHNDGGQEDTSLDSVTIISEESVEGDQILVEKGCYLGLFTKYGKGPVEQHFFKLDKKAKVLLFSREEHADTKHIEKLKVLSVKPLPSVTVRGRLDYSPQHLHKFAFCIITTQTGPMDVLAYAERAYTGWLRELTKLCQRQEAAVDNLSHLSVARNCDETDDDDIDHVSVSASSPGMEGWTDHSFVHKELQTLQTPTKNNVNFITSTPRSQNSCLKQSLKAQHSLSSRQMIQEESSVGINNDSTVIPSVSNSTSQKSQPDHLPTSVIENDDIV